REFRCPWLPRDPPRLARGRYVVRNRLPDRSHESRVRRTSHTDGERGRGSHRDRSTIGPCHDPAAAPFAPHHGGGRMDAARGARRRARTPIAVTGTGVVDLDRPSSSIARRVPHECNELSQLCSGAWIGGEDPIPVLLGGSLIRG